MGDFGYGKLMVKANHQVYVSWHSVVGENIINNRFIIEITFHIVGEATYMRV